VPERGADAGNSADASDTVADDLTVACDVPAPARIQVGNEPLLGWWGWSRWLRRWVRRTRREDEEAASVFLS
jgi:hypothetical protein